MNPQLPASGPVPARSMSQVLMFEFLIVLIVVGVVAGYLIREIPASIEKAGFTEVLMSSRQGQIAMMERLAIAGPGQAGAADAAFEPPVKASGRFALSHQVQGERYLLNGKFPHREKRFSLAFAPSVIQNEPAGSVLWLCGLQRPPAGWTGPPQGPGTDLSPSELPFVCRHHGG